MIEQILNLILLILLVAMGLGLLCIALITIKMEQIIKWSKENDRSSNESN